MEGLTPEQLASNMLIVLLIYVLMIGYYIFYGITFSRVAKAEKQPKPWFAWIPLLNEYQLIKIVGAPMWLLVPIILAVASTGVLGSMAFFLVAIPNVYLFAKIADRYDVSIWWFILGLFPPTFFLNVIGFFFIFKAAKNGPIKHRVQTKAFNGKSQVNKQSSKKKKK